MELRGNMAGCSFVEVSKTAMDLTKLTVTGYTGSISEGFEIQILDDLGRTLNTYFWQDYTKKKETYYGWKDGNANKMVEEGEVILPAGKGIWVYSTVENLKLVCNGEVLTAGQAIPLQNRGLMVSNPYPVDVNLADMWGSGYESSISEGFEVQFLDDLGRTLNTYFWQDYTKKKETYYGWKDGNANKMITREDNVIIGAGKAVWTYCTMPDGKQFYLNFPAILQDTAE